MAAYFPETLADFLKGFRVVAAQHSAFARKLGAFVALSGAEFSALDRLHGRRKKFPAGRDMVHQGQINQSAYILASGWACSYKLLSSGTRRM